MSYDYNIYVKHIERFSREACEVYIRTRGPEAHIPHDFDPLTHSGFVGIGSMLPSPDGTGERFQSGFEYDISAHVFEPLPPRKPTLWERLRGIKSIEPESDPYPDAVHDVCLSCHWLEADTYAIPLALAFAGYFVHACDGVLCDPQEGRDYTDPAAIDEVIRSMMEEIEEE